MLLDPAEKREMFAGLLGTGAPATAGLTLALAASPGRIAEGAARPDLVVGFATLSPWKDRRLVEILPGPSSAPGAVAAAELFFRRLGRDTAIVGNVPGGVFPRIFAMIVNEAAFALGEGVASAEDIDIALRLGANYPDGPLTLARRAGPDVLMALLEGLHRETGDERYRAAPHLRSLLAGGTAHGGASGGVTKGD